MNSCTIRKYKDGDKENLRYICRETAGEYFLKSERLHDAVPVIYSDYFTENESENIFVLADGDDKAVGYIICSTDCRLFYKKMQSVYVPRAVREHVGMLPVCIGYLAAMRRGGKKNSVHLHIDILDDYQHMGYGTQLIDALRAELYSRGIENLSVNTIDRGESAYKFYMKYGFKENIHLIGNIVSLTIPTKKQEAVK